MREDWIKTNALAAAAVSGDDEEDINFNAESFTGEMV